jgi:hypothetical protein
MAGSHASVLGGQEDTLSRVPTQTKLQQSPEMYPYQFKVYYFYILGNSVFNKIHEIKVINFLLVLKYSDGRIDIIITNTTDLGSYTINLLDICHFL